MLTVLTVIDPSTRRCFLLLTDRAPCDERITIAWKPFIGGHLYHGITGGP